MSLCGTICFALKSYTTSLIGMSAHISAEFVKKKTLGVHFLARPVHCPSTGALLSNMTVDGTLLRLRLYQTFYSTKRDIIKHVCR